jgi:hypothetical protein
MPFLAKKNSVEKQRYITSGITRVFFFKKKKSKATKGAWVWLPLETKQTRPKARI